MYNSQTARMASQNVNNNNKKKKATQT